MDISREESCLDTDVVEEIEEATPRQLPSSVMDGCVDIFFINLSRMYRAAKPNITKPNIYTTQKNVLQFKIVRSYIKYFTGAFDGEQIFCNVFWRMWSNGCKRRGRTLYRAVLWGVKYKSRNQMTSAYYECIQPLFQAVSVCHICFDCHFVV